MEKKLYRIENGKKIAGVCGGIAEYLKVDVTLIRAIWAVVTLFTVGTGLLAYLVCAFILPVKPEDGIVDAQ